MNTDEHAHAIDKTKTSMFLHVFTEVTVNYFSKLTIALENCLSF